ncbi:cytochrome c/FTR1 family iron permease [Aequorivita capsosiphonis]|uniref:cytochrome c/FTR1 family iron permease n=1 Tax=Aequorivita capsosiphonis TaxID=487317 RepID=UPI00041F5CD6|nr:FTR1 family protein [Aequorivita capsosiphonis]
MSKVFVIRFLMAVLLIFAISPAIIAQTNDKNAETVIHLLDYIARDYPEGVQNGEIINKQEYGEMQEFSGQAFALTEQGSFLPKKERQLLDDLAKLKDFIQEKKPEQEISDLAREIRNKLLEITGIQTAPALWPNSKRGKALFANNCASCHGINGKGNGALGKGLDPAPTDFHEAQLMRQVSPFQAYNTIKLGVNGTSMRPFSELNEEELWDLAFYVKSLRFQKDKIDTTALRAQFETVFPNFTLKNVATHSDEEILANLAKTGDKANIQLKSLRLLAPTGTESNNSLAIAKENLNAALKNYTAGNKSLARTNALSAYLEGIEPVEARLTTNDPGFTIEIEQQMLNVRQAIEQDQGVPALKVETDKALAMIDQADQLMKDHKLNYWLTFILAASIMLREGLEAFLILAVVLALIRTSGVKKALPWLHGGWITAVILGLAGWYLSDYIIQFGGKNREIMEGLISLFAVLVLLFVGFWLHNHSHAKKWQEFIENKIGRYLQKDKMFGLAAFSFMVVFREAFEVILFLQAINLEAQPENKSAIGLGVLAAIAGIAVMVFLFLKYSKKIPVRQLFRYSSWIIVLLAIILIGKGFHSLQESGWISVTGFPSLFRIDWLGFYPTLETILAQIVLIIIILITYQVHNQRVKKMILKES